MKKLLYIIFILNFFCSFSFADYIPDRGPSVAEIDQMNLEDLANRVKVIDKIIERNAKTKKAYIVESEKLKKIAAEKEVNNKKDLIKKLKEKCEALGFEINTPKNGKCVLELMQ
jgi:peptidoglycan hydrolase CwlO-like protein